MFDCARRAGGSYHHQLPGLTISHERILRSTPTAASDLVVIPASQSVGPIRDEVVLYDPDQRITGAFEQRPVTPEQVREWAFGGWCALADRASTCVAGRHGKRCSG